MHKLFSQQQCVDAQTCQAMLYCGKTPLQFFGEHGVNKLMCLVQVFHKAQLPPLWSRLAATPKMSHLMTVQSSFNEQWWALNVYFEVPVSISLVTKLITLSFASANQDDLTQGINPFLFGLATPQQKEQLDH